MGFRWMSGLHFVTRLRLTTALPGLKTGLKEPLHGTKSGSLFLRDVELVENLVQNLFLHFLMRLYDYQNEMVSKIKVRVKGF